MEYTIGYARASAIPIYIQNLIRALMRLPDERKPFVYVLYNNDSPLQDLLNIHYPFLKLIPQYPNSPIIRAVNRLYRVISGSKYSYFHGYPEVDVVFPYFEASGDFYGNKIIEWITDFQQLYLPEFFKKDELDYSHNRYQQISKSGCRLVFSSHDARQDFNKFYPDNNNKISVLRFASVLPEFDFNKLPEVKKKYGINNTYYITPNQFWPHKNHELIIHVCDLLRQKHPETNYQFVFTGATSSYRNDNRYNAIIELIRQKKLENYFVFTNFIPREDQLILMKGAKAIIQPSLFEGWSTLVEECKALGKFLLVSDIGVHREQIDKNCQFFNPKDPLDLLHKLELFHVNNHELIEIDYQQNVLKFAEDILALIESDGQ